MVLAGRTLEQHEDSGCLSCRRDTQPSSPHSVKLRQEGRPDPCEGSMSTDPMSPTGCLLYPMHQIQGLWVWETLRKGLGCMHTPKERKHQPRATFPGGLVPQGLELTPTCIHSGITHSRFFLSLLLFVFLSPCHKSNLRRSIKSQSQTLTHTSPGTAILLR